MKRKPFTLIELLVVIAIVAILASLLLPALSYAKRVTNTVVCKNKLKQIALSATLYADDWDGILPHEGGRTGSATFYTLSKTSWHDKIDGYEEVDDGKFTNARNTITNCPETIRQFSLRPRSDGGRGYSINHYRGGWIKDPSRHSELRFQTLNEDIFWFSDVRVYKKMTDGRVFIYNGLAFKPISNPGDAVPFMWENWVARKSEPFRFHGHSGGNTCNFVFADAHVDNLRLQHFYDISGEELHEFRGNWWWK